MPDTFSESVPRQLRRVTDRRPADPSRPGLPDAAAPTPRVRHQVRDGAVVVVFSATASTVVALALLVLVRVAG